MCTEMTSMFMRSVLVWAWLIVINGCHHGSFWQVTDIHYDANYSVPTSQELAVCRQGRGRYGEYPCDSPWTLVASALSWMNSTQPQPDFILWTGDSVPHEADSELNSMKVLTLVKNVTDELLQLFPSSKILPSIGNHDIWPSNQVPPVPAHHYYEALLNYSGWDNMLDENTAQHFLKGGFYSSSHGSITLLAINTILWYDLDQLTINQTDPLDQFTWLTQQLQQARRDEKKVIIHGHVPPGMLARAPLAWYRPHHNSRLALLLAEYGDVVTAAIFGHEHTDSFRVVRSKQGKSVPMFLTPAITPWESTIPGLGAVNPALRLYHYCRDTGQITDYDQYFLNLTQANEQSEAIWELEYTLTDAYDINDASADSLLQIVSKFQSDPDSFNKYFRFNSVSQDLTSSCRGACVVQHICAILYIDYEEYNKCREEGEQRVRGEWFPFSFDDNDNDDEAWWWTEKKENCNYALDNKHHHCTDNPREKQDTAPGLQLKNGSFPLPVIYIMSGLGVCICLMIATMTVIRARDNKETEKVDNDETYQLLSDPV